jgi:hypothetical protein
VNVIEIEITEAEIRAAQEAIAARYGMTVAEAYAALKEEPLRGTIAASHLSMLRFLLGEDE